MVTFPPILHNSSHFLIRTAEAAGKIGLPGLEEEGYLLQPMLLFCKASEQRAVIRGVPCGSGQLGASRLQHKEGHLLVPEPCPFPRHKLSILTNCKAISLFVSISFIIKSSTLCFICIFLYSVTLIYNALKNVAHFWHKVSKTLWQLLGSCLHRVLSSVILET